MRWKEALEILQKGKGLSERSRAKDPGLCCSERLCGMAMCLKKPFADEPFDYFLAKK
ncbi:hypothetical protein RG47T_3134 [Mucilaginibacter polytrichastri]|uniref:Uncharacterized protein n=1 Tax=Mucilaginibacter polytrichastri TaxID=1302689 RepID=A0A1Q6A119_9SPHI|nr:hypothetical protein RG47T_3134 [Mucilaginibacter polytrichastri]